MLRNPRKSAIASRGARELVATRRNWGLTLLHGIERQRRCQPPAGLGHTPRNHVGGARGDQLHVVTQG